MKRKMILATLAVLGCTAVSTGINPAQASQVYELDGIEVNADADKTVDQFGNVVTSQSYYRTGGDEETLSAGGGCFEIFAWCSGSDTRRI